MELLAQDGEEWFDGNLRVTRQHKDFATVLLKDSPSVQRCFFRDGDQDRNIVGGLNQAAGGGEGGQAIEHHPEGGTWSGRSCCEARIVSQCRADADHDRVHPASRLMNQRPRFVARNPLAMTTAGGSLAVESHGPLGDDVRQLRRQPLEVGGVELGGEGGGGFGPDLDENAGRAKDGQTATIDTGKRVTHGGHHPGHARSKYRVGTRRRLAMVATRFESDIKRRARAAPAA